MRRIQENQSWTSNCEDGRTEGEGFENATVLAFEDGRGPRNMGNISKLEKVRKAILFWSSQKQTALLTASWKPTETHFRILTSLTGRKQICIVISNKLVRICKSSKIKKASITWNRVSKREQKKMQREC